MTNTFNFSAINLGCNKNLVDLEFSVGEILKLSNETKINYFENPEDNQVEYIVINTCGFLSSSREEAENTIKYYDDLGKKTIIIGCYLPVKDNNFLLSLKNLYSVVPYNENKDIGKISLNNQKLEKLKTGLSKLKEDKLQKYLGEIGGTNLKNKAFIWKSDSLRAYFNAPYGFEYLKIAEGCDNNCSFCIIPSIRGRQKSRSIEDILKEVYNMLNNGIKEIEIISQDTTRYGTDLSENGDSMLIELLEKIDKIDADFKIKLFYVYPDTLTMDNLKRLKYIKKLLPYFDIPFQHISPKILKIMGRFYNDNHIFKVLDFIKEEFNNAFIHTNFIVGFPGENENDFKQLVNFAKKYEFDSVSLFGYHDEPLAPSSKLPNKVDDKTIISRVNILSKALNKIYDKKEKDRKGKKEIGYIMDIYEKSLIVRPEIKAPEIDEYDEILYNQIISGEIEIGKKIEYKK